MTTYTQAKSKILKTKKAIEQNDVAYNEALLKANVANDKLGSAQTEEVAALNSVAEGNWEKARQLKEKRLLLERDYNQAIVDSFDPVCKHYGDKIRPLWDEICLTAGPHLTAIIELFEMMEKYQDETGSCEGAGMALKMGSVGRPKVRIVAVPWRQRTKVKNRQDWIVEVSSHLSHTYKTHLGHVNFETLLDVR